MTNEQLAAFIKEGGNDELIPILWERIRKIMYMKSDRAYSALQGKFIKCGVDIWDLKQSCYTAFLKAIRGYNPDSGNKFTSYLSYPFQNVVQELTGCRTVKGRIEPLNDCTSFVCYGISKSNSIKLIAPEQVELKDDYRILHEAVDRLKYPQNVVINRYYFEEKTLKDIGAEIGVCGQTAGVILHNGLRCLRRSEALRQLYIENK